MDKLSASFTLTGDDYEQYLRYFYAHTPKGRRQMRRLYAVGVALILVFIGLGHDHPRFGMAQPGTYAAYAAITILLFGGIYWYLIARLWPALAKGAVQVSPQKGMFTDTTLFLDACGMDIHTDQGKGRLDWDNVAEVADTNDGIYLFMGGINAFIIPKRAFQSPDDAEGALGLILKVVAPESEPPVS